MRLCCVTNVYNEHFNLPLWIKYYGGQVGLSNCVVLDHGSDPEAMVSAAGASVVRLPRSEFDDVRRSRAVSAFVDSMLGYYDAVLYTDCDEILVADPRKFKGLADYASWMTTDAVTAIGMNVVHEIYSEDPLHDRAPILAQRNWIQFVSPMCKTLLTRAPIRWGGGFHSSSAPVHFSDLYLFHLRPVDLGESLKRLSITRKIDWADERAGLHQRRENKAMLDLFQHYASWPKSDNFDETAAQFTAQVKEHVQHQPGNQLYYVPFDQTVSGLMRIPEWFGTIF